MELNSHFRSFGENDVLAFSDYKMCKAGKFKTELCKFFEGNDVMNLAISRLESIGIQGLNTYNEKQNVQNSLWMTQGKECEVLKVGAQDWIKGRLKVRMIVEFEPETPEPIASTLDDIRQMVSD